MRDQLGKLYFIIFALVICYALSAYIAVPKQTQYYDMGAEITEIHPSKIEQLDESTKLYTLPIHAISDTSRAIKFISLHEDVEVYSNGNLVFERKVSPSIFGKTPGQGMNLVELPVDTTEVQVKTHSVYANVRNNQHTFYYGNGPLLMDEMFRESVFPMATNWMIFLIGIFMLSFWIITHKKFMIGDSLAYFSVFTLLLGAWEINETNISMLLIQNRVFGSIFSFLMIGLLVYPFIQFIRSNLELERTFYFYVVTHGSLVAIIILTLLHLLGICDFRQSSFVLHIFLFMSLGYIIHATIYCYRKRIKRKKICTNLIAFVSLTFASILDMISFYSYDTETLLLGKLGIFIFILALAVQLLSDSYIQINEGKKALYYKDLAYTDLMTGLYNRGAFEQWEQETTDYNGVTIVTFDLNNLKQCNDTMGHSMGDSYITTSARLIKQCFDEIGKGFRIGGDEFCVIIQNRCTKTIDASLKKLMDAQEDYNRQSKDLQIGISYGVATYSPEDSNFEATRSRADEDMYLRKRFQKANLQSIPI